MVSDPQTNTQKTGPITIHCAAKLSTQCNYTTVTRTALSRAHTSAKTQQSLSVQSTPIQNQTHN